MLPIVGWAAITVVGCSVERTCDAGENGVGACCSADRDCQQGLTCLTRVPGGMCTRVCQRTSDCPSGAFCIRIVSARAGDLGLICLVGCSGPQDCPSGLSCILVNEGKNIRVCFPEI